LQATIARMGQNSFLVKGWSTTLVAALFALAAKDSNPNYGFIAFSSIPVFWWLDGLFLATEKRFRELYDQVSRKDEAQIDFTMDPLEFAKTASVVGAMRSKTIWPFHGILLFSAIAVTWIVPAMSSPKLLDQYWNFFFHRDWL
jgi:hypothetical protein